MWWFISGFSLSHLFLLKFMMRVKLNPTSAIPRPRTVVAWCSTQTPDLGRVSLSLSCLSLLWGSRMFKTKKSAYSFNAKSMDKNPRHTKKMISYMNILNNFSDIYLIKFISTRLYCAWKISWNVLELYLIFLSEI